MTNVKISITKVANISEDLAIYKLRIDGNRTDILHVADQYTGHIEGLMSALNSISDLNVYIRSLEGPLVTIGSNYNNTFSVTIDI